MTVSQNQLFMRQAKAMLEGNWWNAALASLIYLLIMAAVSSTYVGELVLYGPLTMGYVLYMIVLTSRRYSDLNVLFDGFNNFAQTLVAGILYSLAVTIGSCLLIVPGIVAALGLGMTFFIMADNPGMTGVDALKASWMMMRGHKMDLFCLMLRFFGWWLLSMITLGVGLVLLYPYILTAKLNFYRALRYGNHH